MMIDGTGRDSVTGLYVCSESREGMRSFAAGVTSCDAKRRAEALLTAAILRRERLPFMHFPGLGFGETEAQALASGWQSLYLAAVRVKIRHQGLVPPEISVSIEANLIRRYRDAGCSVLLRDCSMLKGYPVIGMEISGRLYSGTGVSLEEALLNCAEYEILARMDGPDTGCSAFWQDMPSYPPGNPFHLDVFSALEDYQTLAERFGSRPKAMKLSSGELQVYQILLEHYDKRMLDEQSLVFGG